MAFLGLENGGRQALHYLEIVIGDVICAFGCWGIYITPYLNVPDYSKPRQLTSTPSQQLRAECSVFMQYPMSRVHGRREHSHNSTNPSINPLRRQCKTMPPRIHGRKSPSSNHGLSPPRSRSHHIHASPNRRWVHATTQNAALHEALCGCTAQASNRVAIMIIRSSARKTAANEEPRTPPPPSLVINSWPFVGEASHPKRVTYRFDHVSSDFSSARAPSPKCPSIGREQATNPKL